MMNGSWRRPPRWLRGARRPLVAGATGATLLASCLGCGALPGQAPSAGPAGRAETEVVADVSEYASELWLTFDERSLAPSGALRFFDSRGRWVGDVEAANGGAIKLAPGPPARGQAVVMPEVCETGAPCPRALISIPDAAPLNPIGADFSYGASVMLPPDQTAKGSNVLQKGRFGSAGGQWKLQVDTLDGLPSCVVQGSLDGERTLVTVRSTTSVADGEWHVVRCAKTASGLAIEVDGEVTREAGDIGTVSNDRPVLVGSAGVAEDDDQFHGHIDDVFLSVDSR